MLEAIQYNDILNDIKEREILNDTIGILFARPESDTGKNIVNSLPYYHHRSGHSINFYLPGYGAYWYNSYPDEENVITIDRIAWSFSYEMYVKFVEDMEKVSKWKYSGESELILLDYCDKRIDYSQMLIFKLDSMLRDNAIYSADSFFEILFRNFPQCENVEGFSNKMGLSTLGQVTMSTILEKLPLSLGTLFIREKHYSIIDTSKFRL